MRPLLITTPIYYVNDVPHIGHAYTTIAADVLARHHRNFGRPVFFLTGTDEHGLKVQQAAAERGIDPKRHCDETVERFISLWNRLNISNDAFIRTTDPEHIVFVQQALTELLGRKEIESRDYEGFYCVPCERFWTDKDLLEQKCPDCRRPVERLKEKNYFFKMSGRRDAIRDAIRGGGFRILPESRRNEVLGFLEQPLSDLCISRPVKRLSWGIPLPFDSGYVTYVWFDALLNYRSALEFAPRARGETRPPGWEEAEIVHLIGKDILTTHAVYWPAMLMGLAWPLPSTLVAHGWWTVEGQKMSKSLGNVVDPNEVAAEFGVDAFRYFLLREVPFGLDGDFSKSSMVGRINHDLADEFGNLVSRLVALVRQKENGEIHLESYVPDAPQGHRSRALAAARELTETFEFSVALGSLSELFSHLNKKINDERPWEADPVKRAATLSTCAVDLARGIFLLSAYTPELAAEAARQMGCADAFRDPAGLFSDQKISRFQPWRISPGKPIVPKREVIPMTTNPPKAVEIPDAASGVIDISDFQKVQLRTARVLSAEKLEGSEKLLKLRVSIGTEERQVVAGIGRQYSPDQLIGKTVVVVVNLKPRKVFGTESQGMILAAGDESSLHLLTVDGAIDPGATIK